MSRPYPFSKHRRLLTFLCLMSLVLAGKAAGADEHHPHGHEEAGGHVVLDEEQMARADIGIEVVSPRTLSSSDTLFGRVNVPADAIYRIAAPYTGIVTQVHVNVGDRVSPGQTLATVRNTSTLQNYTIDSPTQGEVTSRQVNRGDSTDRGTLLELVDLGSVWVDISAFADTIQNLETGLPVTIRDIHQHEMTESRISYVSPLMTAGHIAIARAVVDNSSGHWRPGMHVTAQIHKNQREVALAVRLEAVQTINGQPVVFVQQDDAFEPLPVELGEDDGEYVEVLGGLTQGTRYVSKNSFVLKADLLKDGVSHSH